MRQMCPQCPFLPGSPRFYVRDGWVEGLAQEVTLQGVPHGCHMIEDEIPCQPENICIGHQDWLNGIKHEENSSCR
jgi:hypothetical protein